MNNPWPAAGYLQCTLEKHIAFRTTGLPTLMTMFPLSMYSSSLQEDETLARSNLGKGEWSHKLSVDHKTLVISRTGRMCIGGSGLCMEGEQRKNQSQARRARSLCLGP